MATDEVQLAWHLSVAGAEEVTQKLSDLHQQFDRGEISVQDYSKGLRNAGSDLNALRNSSQLSTRAWQAQHPQLNMLSRSMSGMSRVMSTVVMAQTAMNVANLLFNQQAKGRQTLVNELAAAERDYNNALTADAKEEASRRVAALKSELEDYDKQMTQQTISNTITFASSIGMIGASIIGALPKLKDLSGAMSGMFKNLGGGNAARALGGMAALGIGATALATGGLDALIGKSETVEDKLKAIGGIGAIGVGIALEFPAIAKIALIGTAIAVATTGIILFRNEIGAAFAFIAEALAPTADAIMNFFTHDLLAWGAFALSWLGSTFGPAFTAIWEGIQTGAEFIWNSLQAGFLALWNGFATVANNAMVAIATGIQSFINGIISGVEAALNAIARLSGGGGISLGRVSIAAPSIPLIAAANGFNGMVTRPTLFLTGERGREHVKVTPGGLQAGGSGGATIVNNFNVEGSIRSDNDFLRMVDKYFVREAHRRGWKP